MRDWPSNPRPHHRIAVFLDRDGTINEDTHYPYRASDLAFLPGALSGLRSLAALPVQIIVVSNQAGIALGRFSREQMSEFNAELRRRVEEAGGRIDAFYFCPHREPKDLGPGGEPCACSKPAPGLLLEAATDFHLDLQKSFLIGDKSSDVAAGTAAGCTTLLVQTGKAGLEEGELRATPDAIVENLAQAADWLREALADRSSGPSERRAIAS